MQTLTLAKVCTSIYREKVLTNGKQIFSLSCASEKLSNEMFIALIRSVLFEERLHVNQSTTTSSAILTQENFFFVPYSVEICTKYVISINFVYDCRSVSKHVLKSYDSFFDVHNSRKRVSGLIYTNNSCRRPVVNLSHATKSHRVNRPLYICTKELIKLII